MNLSTRVTAVTELTGGMENNASPFNQANATVYESWGMAPKTGGIERTEGKELWVKHGSAITAIYVNPEGDGFVLLGSGSLIFYPQPEFATLQP